MVRVACTMMQKNEAALLEPWLAYHGDLFGFENLYVFDNGSTIPSVLETLQTYQKLGIHLDWKYKTVAEYALKGDIISECIRDLQSQQSYDLVFPLDCYEFVVLKDGSEATVDREKIKSHAESLVSAGGLFRVNKQFFNIINRPGEFGVGDYTKTVIVPDGSFQGSDHGHHHCTNTNGVSYQPCEFAFVHYHYKPLAMLREHARAKLAPFVDVDDVAAVTCFTGPGHHLRPYLSMTEEQFQNWHGGDKFYAFDAFTDRLGSLNVSIPF